MNISGLQKMTLLDFPGLVACTVFLGGCDMRCPFCHNAELLTPQGAGDLDEGTLLDFLSKRKSLLDGVVITGGEPLLNADLPELLEKIKALGFSVKIDTNGTHPDLLKKIVGAGLSDYVAMDIKNSPARYAETAGVKGFDISHVEESAAYLLSGPVRYEFRTTVVRELHDRESFEDIARWIEGAEDYYLQSFEDRDTVPYAGFHAPEAAEMLEFADILRPHVKNVGIRGM